MLKERILKAVREKQVVFIQGNLHKTMNRIFRGNPASHKEQHDICKVLKEKHFQSRIFYLAAGELTSEMQ